MTSTKTTPDVAHTAKPRLGLSSRLTQDLGLWAVLIVLIIGFSIASPYFLSVQNLTNVLQSVAILGVMAALMTLVLVNGALDLSVGSITALSGVVAASLVAGGWHPLAAFLAAIVTGMLCGLFNGLAVIGLRINPIIVTIGTLALFRGVAYVVTDGRDIVVNDGISNWIAFSQIAFLPVTVWIMILVFALTWWFATYTPAGRNIYAVGANAKASRLAGLPVDRIRLGVLVGSGTAAGLAGILLNAQSGSAVPGAASGYELQVLTAVLIGGTSLAGGAGRVTMTLVGVLIIGVVYNGMTLLGVPSYYQTIASGLLLLVAVALDQLRRGKGFK